MIALIAFAAIMAIDAVIAINAVIAITAIIAIMAIDAVIAVIASNAIITTMATVAIVAITAIPASNVRGILFLPARICFCEFRTYAIYSVVLPTHKILVRLKYLGCHFNISSRE